MVAAVPPTSHLPPIKQITTKTLNSLNDNIHYLRSIYNPEVRGSRRRRKSHNKEKISLIPSTITPQESYLLNHLRADPFERAYAIKWLTSLISILYTDVDEEDTTATQEKDKTIQNASSLLSACAGTSAAGTIVRDFTFIYYQSVQGSEESTIPITVQLIDIPLDNDDFGTVGAQTWGSSCVLSELIIEQPHSFGITPNQLNNHNHNHSTFRILELGAGTGLVSLTLGKLIHHLNLTSTHCQIEIIATDYHPSVLTNLRNNVHNNNNNVHNNNNNNNNNNFSSSTNKSSPVSISIHQFDWSSFSSSEDSTAVSSFEEEESFDMILGADIVYEPQHATWIQSCITRLLRKPLAATLSHPYATQAFFHLVIPLRATHALESDSVEAVFTSNPNSQKNSLQVLSKDTITCDTETGEEVEYIYFKVGWI